MVLKNIDYVFFFPPPCATQDMVLWGQPPSAFGTPFNGDFLMFEPSLEEFNKIVDEKRKEMEEQGGGKGNMIIKIRN